MKKNQKLKTIIVTLIIATLMTITTNTNVKAATNSYSMGIETNKNTIQEGENLEISLSLKDIKIETGDKGLGAYQATIEYDTEIFEYISIEGLNSWETPIYNNGTFATTTKTGEVIKEDEYVARITLKVKKNITQKSTTIKIKNITATTGAETIETKNISKTIEIKTTKSETNNTTNNTTNSTTTNTNKDTTTATTKIPKAGTNQTIIIVAVITGIIAIATGGWIYKTRKEIK